MTIRKTIIPVVVAAVSLAAVTAFIWPGFLRSPERASGSLVYQGSADAGFAIYTMRGDGSGVRRVPLEGKVGFPRFSPNGRALAFIGEAEDGREDLYVAEASGRNPRAIAASRDEPEGAPAWSPDGGTIVFSSRRDGNWEIYAVAPDGSNLRRLTNDQAVEGSPVFSPDGRTIAFASDRGGGDSHIYFMNSDGSGVRRITSGEDESAPDFSPDGRFLAFVGFTAGNADIWISGVDGSRPRRVTTDEVFEFTPRWSPDGRWIAFEAYVDQSTRVPDIFVVHSDGSARQKLTHSGLYAGAPSWVPQMPSPAR